MSQGSQEGGASHDVYGSLPPSTSRAISVRVPDGVVIPVVIDAGADVATRSNQASTGADQLVLAVNLSRKGAVIYYDGAAVAYLGLGTVAVSATSFTTIVQPNAPFFLAAGETFEVRGLVASGTWRVTEFT